MEKEYPHLALARLSGLRPWRVVAAPALRGRGFGQKALEQLELHVRRGVPFESFSLFGLWVFQGVLFILSFKLFEIGGWFDLSLEFLDMIYVYESKSMGDVLEKTQRLCAESHRPGH